MIPSSTTAERGMNDVAHTLPARLTWRSKRMPWSASTTACGLWLALLSGGAAVVYAYVLAARGGGEAYFAVFWLGMTAFLVPAAIRIASSSAARGERLFLVATVGLFEFLPKLLRDPSSPLYSDELAHWRQTEVVRNTGKLFAANPLIWVIQGFPGLHAVTAALGELSGLSTWSTAEVLLAALHMLTLVGVFLIGERVARSATVGAIAALIYAVAPNYVFFNSQFSYESLAIVLVIWCLVCVVVAHDEQRSTISRRAWLGLAGVLALATVPTHHLSSYLLVSLLLALASLHTLRRRQAKSGLTAELWLLTAVAGLAAVCWAVFVAPDIGSYLGQPLEAAVKSVGSLLSGHRPRALFKGSGVPQDPSVPIYEKLAAFLTPVLVVIAAAAAMSRIWRERDYRPLVLMFAGLALAYFASVPFILTAAGGESAQRSWAFSYLGLAVVVAPVIDRLLRGARQRIAPVALLVAAFVVVLVGNVSADQNVEYRFPGPYVYGSDTRSLTGELRATTAWLDGSQATGLKVIADRYSGLALGSFGDEWVVTTSPGFPVWELYSSDGHPSPQLMAEVAASGYSYLVVDKRMAEFKPLVGPYFNGSEPAGFHVSRADLAALDRAPWLIKIWDSGNIEIFRFNFSEAP
jgi:hypothetical protein